MSNKEVYSEVQPLKTLFADKYDVDFYQREYVWKKEHLEDLIKDLSLEFLRNWKENDTTERVQTYEPYYMGEVVISKVGARNAIIDGQQRITTFTLLLMYLAQKHNDVAGFPKAEIDRLIYSDYFGSKRFNLEIEDRKECMLSLYENGNYVIKGNDTVSAQNLVDRYNDIEDCWDEGIDERNVTHFAYWIKEKIMFSKVWTNSNEFAYIIFETMNDRGLSLTQVEMLRSYLLAKVDEDKRSNALKVFDDVVKLLKSISTKAEFDFFKMYFRGHYAEDLSQKNPDSDFVKIGNKFNRWFSESDRKLGLIHSNDYIEFLNRIAYFAGAYKTITDKISERNTENYLYLIVNSDYGFTLQPVLLLAAVAYQDDEETINQKIRIISKYLTKVLTWRIWNHWMISQSSLEATIYDLCKTIRSKSIEDIKVILANEPIALPKLDNIPTLNQQNRNKLRVLLALITEIVARNSGEPNYILNNKDIEVEHIWANHYEEHQDECDGEWDFSNTRNQIGDLLVLPKTFNASYGDDPYEEKVKHYYGQNILAQSLNKLKYENNPGFLRFVENSSLPFMNYSKFTRNSILERSDLYKRILEWNWD